MHSAVMRLVTYTTRTRHYKQHYKQLTDINVGSVSCCHANENLETCKKETARQPAEESLLVTDYSLSTTNHNRRTQTQLQVLLQLTRHSQKPDCSHGTPAPMRAATAPNTHRAAQHCAGRTSTDTAAVRHKQAVCTLLSCDSSHTPHALHTT